MFESFMASSGSSSPKPKLSQPPSLSLHSEPFLIPSGQPTRGERWNQAKLGHFDPHLDDKADGAGEIVSLRKDVYYQNVIFFIQHIEYLVTFRGANLVMANIANSLRSSALEWYTSELDDQKRERHHRDSSVDS